MARYCQVPFAYAARHQESNATPDRNSQLSTQAITAGSMRTTHLRPPRNPPETIPPTQPARKTRNHHKYERPSSRRNTSFTFQYGSAGTARTCPVPYSRRLGQARRAARANIFAPASRPHPQSTCPVPPDATRWGGGSTTLVGQLPNETMCPDPPANLFPCPGSTARERGAGIFPCLSKKRSPPRRGRNFCPRRGSFPRRTKADQFVSSSSHNRSSRRRRDRLAFAKKGTYLDPTAKNAKRRDRVSTRS